MKAALALISLAVLALDAQPADNVRAQAARTVRAADIPDGESWLGQKCTLARCDVTISVTPPVNLTGRDCEFKRPDFVRVRDRAFDGYVATTTVRWTLVSSDASVPVRFGWTNPQRLGIRVRDSVLADDDPLDTSTSTTFGRFIISSASDKEGATAVDQTELRKRIYFYRIFVEYQKSNGVWERCHRDGPMILNNG